MKRRAAVVFSCKQLYRYPESIDIGALVGLHESILLWSCKPVRSYKCSILVGIGFLDPCSVKVYYSDMPVIGKHNVRGFDIAVDNTGSVQCSQAVAYRTDYFRELLCRYIHLRQRSAGYVLHFDLIFREACNSHDVRGIYCRDLRYYSNVKLSCFADVLIAVIICFKKHRAALRAV